MLYKSQKIYNNQTTNILSCIVQHFIIICTGDSEKDVWKWDYSNAVQNAKDHYNSVIGEVN
jgi:hypothetical protein